MSSAIRSIIANAFISMRVVVVLLFFMPLSNVYGKKNKPHPPTKNRSENVLLVEIEDFTTMHLNNSVLLVKIAADWCPACKKIATLFHEIAQEFTASLRCVQLNIDSFDETDPTIKLLQSTYKVSISSLPTFLLFKNQKMVNKFEGPLSSANLKKKINTSLELC